MNSGKKNIFSGSHHFTSDELVRYVHHVLSEQEQHEMEKHLVDCELCSEALKGIAEMENASLLYEVNKDLRFRASRKRLLKKKIFSQNELISIFAVVFLIIFLLLMTVFFFLRKDKEGNNVPSDTQPRIENQSKIQNRHLDPWGRESDSTQADTIKFILVK